MHKIILILLALSLIMTGCDSLKRDVDTTSGNDNTQETVDIEKELPENEKEEVFSVDENDTSTIKNELDTYIQAIGMTRSELESKLDNFEYVGEYVGGDCYIGEINKLNEVFVFYLGNDICMGYELSTKLLFPDLLTYGDENGHIATKDLEEIIGFETEFSDGGGNFSTSIYFDYKGYLIDIYCDPSGDYVDLNDCYSRIWKLND